MSGLASWLSPTRWRDLVDDADWTSAQPASLWRRMIVSAPERLMLAVAAVFAVCSVCAEFRVFFPWLVIPLCVAAVVGTWWLGPRSVRVDRPAIVAVAVAVAFVVAWLALNLPFASQYLVAIRDPGIYYAAGAHLAQAGNVTIDATEANRLVATLNDPSVTADLGAFGTRHSNTIQLQGSSGVPAIFALGFWAGGVFGESVVNLVVGAVGLLAVYGFARRVVGPRWGLVPLALLGASMPYIYLSRTTYTEIMASLLLVGGATWTFIAFRSGRLRDFAVAGALVGAAGLTRVDGALGLMGAIVGLVLVAIGVGRSTAERGLLARFAVFAGAGVVAVLLGIVDLELNVPRYIHDLGSRPLQLWAGTVAALVVMVVLLAIPALRRSFEWRRARGIVAIVAGAAIIGLGAFWASRPLWMHEHTSANAATINEIAGLQAQDGLPIDGSQGYDAYSLLWFAWYFGAPFLILIVLGLAAWLWWAIAHRKAAHVVVLATLAVTAVLYLDQLAVTPDQIWAFRRVLPTIATTFLVAGVIPLRMLARRAVWRKVLAGVLVGVTGILTLSPWGQIFFSVEGSDQAQEISAICRPTQSANLIVLVDVDAPPNYGLTLRTVCDKQVVVVEGQKVLALGASGSSSWTGLAALDTTGSVGVVSFEPGLVPWQKPPAPTTHAVVHFWTRHLLQAPRTTTLSVRDSYVGILQPDGSVAEVAP